MAPKTLGKDCREQVKPAYSGHFFLYRESAKTMGFFMPK